MHPARTAGRRYRFAQTLAARTRVFGEAHPANLRTASALAGALRKLGAAGRLREGWPTE